MSRASWIRIGQICGASAGVASCMYAQAPAKTAVAGETLAIVLARYEHAMNDPDAPPLAHVETAGVESGSGLAGTFHTWVAGERERSDEALGPRLARTLRLGERYWILDENGMLRELTGVLARRARTQSLIDSGAFALQPEHCALRGRTRVDGDLADVLEITARDGDTETLYLSAATGLPMRLAFDDDDGRATIDSSNWRTVAGHRFAYKTVISDGDREFDTTQIVQNVDVASPPEPLTFAPLMGRHIEMTGVDTVPLIFRDGHLLVSARISGHSYTFLVDTGSQNIVLDRHVADELGLVSLGDLEASGAKRTGGLGLVQLNNFAIGRASLPNLVVSTIDLHGSTGGAFRIDGILGYPFFASALVRIDFANRSLMFGPPDAFVPAGEKLNLDVDRAIPDVELRANDVAAPFIVDTGNGAGVLLYKPFVERHGGLVPYTQSFRSSYGIGGATGSYRTSLDRLDIGSITLYHLDTDVMQATRGAFADRFDAGNVGLGVLDNLTITLDLANSAMYVERGSQFDDGRSRN